VCSLQVSPQKFVLSVAAFDCCVGLGDRGELGLFEVEVTIEAAVGAVATGLLATICS